MKFAISLEKEASSVAEPSQAKAEGPGLFVQAGVDLARQWPLRLDRAIKL